MIAKKLFSDFAKNGGAVLLVTHTLPVAEEIATRIGVLTSGVLHTEGTISELRSRAGGTSVATLEEIFPRLTQHS
jgi:ABC-2 type transport system ATP-binding protein